MPEWTPDQCRAKRWNGTPVYEGAHEHHLFTYGPGGIYTGHCAGRYETDNDVAASNAPTLYPQAP